MECLGLELEAFHMKEELSPGDKADLKLGSNVIDDPFCVADAKWPRLQMLNFCDSHHYAVWFQNCVKVDPRGPNYQNEDHLRFSYQIDVDDYL